MKKATITLIVLFVATLFVTLVRADFYVIPVKTPAECTGDATTDDVLKGKTFSNASATDLTGTRPTSPVAKTGLSGSHSHASGDDADLEMGVSWPVPRFKAGTYVVTDNLTGVMWERYPPTFTDTRNWSRSIIRCNTLTVLEPLGQFTITYSDWRLANVKELLSLIDWGEVNPSLPAGHPFVGLQGPQWSSSTCPLNTGHSFYVNVSNGYVECGAESIDHCGVCVRGGQ